MMKSMAGGQEAQEHQAVPAQHGEHEINQGPLPDDGPGIHDSAGTCSDERCWQSVEACWGDPILISQPQETVQQVSVRSTPINPEPQGRGRRVTALAAQLPVTGFAPDFPRHVCSLSSICTSANCSARWPFRVSDVTAINPPVLQVEQQHDRQKQ